MSRDVKALFKDLLAEKQAEADRQLSAQELRLRAAVQRYVQDRDLALTELRKLDPELRARRWRLFFDRPEELPRHLLRTTTGPLRLGIANDSFSRARVVQVHYRHGLGWRGRDGDSDDRTVELSSVKSIVEYLLRGAVDAWVGKPAR